MADAAEAREVTGYAIGGTPPFGHPTPIRTLIDPSLLDHEIVYGAGGTPDRCFPIAAARLAEVTNSEAVVFTG
jgi:prolyl-tRNA editing enzyme YbaK/EbsC (Cys-tRNA(Pro) deacylase)